MPRKRILVVEDQPDIRQLIAMVLDGGEYELAEAHDAEQALSLAHGFRPDLVLMDVMMPGPIDGFEACACLKNDPGYGQPLVLMLSARTEQADFNRGSVVGADAYLSKPFSVAVLESTVTMLLAGR